MPKIVNHQLKKTEIATQAIRVFSEKGYYNTKLSDIAKICNMGRTSLYKYFSNKDEIYYYILEMGLKLYKEHYQVVDKNPELSYLEKITTQIHYLVTHLNGKSITKAFLDFWLMVRHNHDALENKVSIKYNEIVNGIIKWLTMAQKNGEIKDSIDVVSTAVIIMGMIHTISLQEMSKRNLDDETAYHSIVHLLEGLKNC